MPFNPAKMDSDVAMIEESVSSFSETMISVSICCHKKKKWPYFECCGTSICTHEKTSQIRSSGKDSNIKLRSQDLPLTSSELRVLAMKKIEEQFGMHRDGELDAPADVVDLQDEVRRPASTVLTAHKVDAGKQVARLNIDAKGGNFYFTRFIAVEQEHASSSLNLLFCRSDLGLQLPTAIIHQFYLSCWVLQALEIYAQRPAAIVGGAFGAVNVERPGTSELARR